MAPEPRLLPREKDESISDSDRAWGLWARATDESAVGRSGGGETMAFSAAEKAAGEEIVVLTGSTAGGALVMVVGEITEFGERKPLVLAGAADCSKAESMVEL